LSHSTDEDDYNSDEYDDDNEEHDDLDVVDTINKLRGSRVRKFNGFENDEDEEEEEEEEEESFEKNEKLPKYERINDQDNKEVRGFQVAILNRHLHSHEYPNGPNHGHDQEKGHEDHGDDYLERRGEISLTHDSEEKKGDINQSEEKRRRQEKFDDGQTATEAMSREEDEESNENEGDIDAEEDDLNGYETTLSKQRALYDVAENQTTVDSKELEAVTLGNRRAVERKDDEMKEWRMEESLEGGRNALNVDELDGATEDSEDTFVAEHTETSKGGDEEGDEKDLDDQQEEESTFSDISDLSSTLGFTSTESSDGNMLEG